jgi:hypothetical protein
MERRGPESNLGKYWLLLYPSPTGTINLQIEAGISTGAPLGGPGAPEGAPLGGPGGTQKEHHLGGQGH